MSLRVSRDESQSLSRLEMKAHIQNHSWGAYSLALGLKNAVETAGAYGHLLVTAAGNEGLDTDQQENYHFPSAFS
eukprot:scaffold89545_cov47-Prasinocladus_malaysianus.AAC.1